MKSLERRKHSWLNYLILWFVHENLVLKSRRLKDLSGLSHQPTEMMKTPQGDHVLVAIRVRYEI